MSNVCFNMYIDVRRGGGAGRGARGHATRHKRQAAHTHTTHARLACPSPTSGMSELRERRHEVLERVVGVALVQELQLGHGRHRPAAAEGERLRLRGACRAPSSRRARGLLTTRASRRRSPGEVRLDCSLFLREFLVGDSAFK